MLAASSVSEPQPQLRRTRRVMTMRKSNCIAIFSHAVLSLILHVAIKLHETWVRL